MCEEGKVSESSTNTDAQIKADGTPPANNLPPSPNDLVGREAELDQIAQHLAMPACRLLTLVGPGGIGKTRLALEAARRYLQPEHALLGPDIVDGVYQVPLASRATSQEVLGAERDAT